MRQVHEDAGHRCEVSSVTREYVAVLATSQRWVEIQLTDIIAGKTDRGTDRQEAERAILTVIKVFIWIEGETSTLERRVGPSTLGNQEGDRLNACRSRLRCIGISPT